VSAGAVPLYRSSAKPGYSSLISNHPQRIVARKLVREIQVRFTAEPCTVQTNEGLVYARPGDAIITGIAGEHWRVSRAHFAAKYRPVPPTVAGESGHYVSLPNRIMCVPMSEPFEVLLADGVSRLHGGAGDWLADYGDGSFGVVSPTIFAVTYEIVEHL
jgi:PGDYG protein